MGSAKRRDQGVIVSRWKNRDPWVSRGRIIDACPPKKVDSERARVRMDYLATSHNFKATMDKYQERTGCTPQEAKTFVFHVLHGDPDE